jgi:zinc protease
LIDKGSATITRQQVQDRLDALQTELGVSDVPGGVAVSLRTRREHLPQAIALVADLLRNPALPPEALEEARQQTLAAIEAQRREPEAVAASALARHANPYPRGDVRYARSFDEMAHDVAAVNSAQVRDFHRQFYGASRAEFSAVGDLDVAAVRAALQAGFADWRSPQPYTRIAQPLQPAQPERMALPTPDKQNATLLARLSLPLSDQDADYPALMMANHLLGGGGNSRLWNRIRETEGLSYDVRASIGWSSHERHSDWMLSAIFAPQNQAKVEAALKDELARALKDGYTAQELAQGQRGLLSQRRLARAQDANLTAALARNLDLGRGFEVSEKVDEAIAQLTLAQVNDALRRYLQPSQFVWVWAGDFKP